MAVEKQSYLRCGDRVLSDSHGPMPILWNEDGTGGVPISQKDVASTKCLLAQLSIGTCIRWERFRPADRRDGLDSFGGKGLIHDMTNTHIIIGRKVFGTLHLTACRKSLAASFRITVIPAFKHGPLLEPDDYDEDKLETYKSIGTGTHGEWFVTGKEYEYVLRPRV